MVLELDADVVVGQVEELIWNSDAYASFCELAYDEGDSRCKTPVTPLNVFYEYDVATGKYGDRRVTREEGIEEMAQVGEGCDVGSGSDEDM